VVLDNSDILASEITFVESYGSINGNSVTLGNGYGLLVLGIGVSGVSDGVAVNAKLMQSSESNLQVSNNDISSNALDGVSVLSSDLVSFESNSVDSNLGAGISVSSSTNVAISDNDITFNGQDGIYWVHSWYGTISGNVVENNSNLQLVAAKTGKTSGFASYSGMFMDPSFYNTIDGNSFSSNAFGVSLEQSDFNNFTQNDISSNAYNGFSVVNSSSNNILGNTITGNVNPYLAQELNQYLKPESVSGFASYSGMFMDPSENNVLEGNTIEGNYGYGLHLLDSTNNTINSNDVNQNAQDGAFIENSDYNKITNNNFTGNSNLDLQAVYLKVMKPGSVGGFASYSGMFMDPSNFNFVANNNFDGNSGTGVYVQASNNNTFGYNKITNNALDGFFLENSSDNQVGYNTITGNVDPTLLGELLSYQKLDRLSGFASYSGMFMDPSHGNQVFGNYIADNYGNGALIQDSDNNLFAGNQLTGNAGSGVAMVDSNNNEISKNTISANSNAALQFKFQNALGSNKPDGFSGFASYSGMFMDPSHGNTVTGNVISDSPEHGVWLQSSSDNVFDGNTISNSGQHGFFIENSNDNTIKNNDIGNNGNETVLNSFLAYGKPEGFTGFASYSGMFMDPSSGNVIENNKVHDNNGFGISTLDSDGNTLKGNKISYNSKEGLNVESSNKLSIQENSFAYNAKYGLKFDQLSKESSVGKNDFVANKGGSQAYDDGGNSFSGNFYLDENPNRAYTIDGSAKTKDYKVSTSPSTDLSSLNFPPVEVGTYILPSKINVGDNHRYLGAWIHFPDGYSSYLVNKTSLYAEFNGENYRVLRAYSFGNHWMYLKIDLRSLGHDLYNYLVSNKLSVTTFDLTIHGSFNGGFLDFYGTDTLVAYKHHKDHDDHHHHRGH
jgi:parallel beta-helix repeat protein